MSPCRLALWLLVATLAYAGAGYFRPLKVYRDPVFSNRLRLYPA